MTPYDYTLQAQPAGLLSGLQAGLAIKQVRDAQDQAELDKARKAQMNADLLDASRDHSKLPAVMVKYPELAEKLKHGWDAMSAEQQRTALDVGTQVYSAAVSGRPDVAAQLLRDRAAAQRNSGDEAGAKSSEAMADSAEAHPEMFAAGVAARLAAVPGGDKVIEAVAKQGGEQRAQQLQPAAVTKANAEAQSAAVTAKFAESKAVSDLKLNDANIAHLAADTEIAKQNSRIAAMNAATQRANSEIERKKLGLQIEEATTKRDDLVRTKVAEVRQGAATLDSLLNTVERIKKHPALNDVVGSIEGSEYFPQTAVGVANTLNPLASGADARNDAIALIDQLTSQATLGQLQSLKQASANGSSGFGALSQKELQVIQSGIQNLTRKQSEKQFRDNLDELSRLMTKNRDVLAAKFGVDAGKPDTPAAPGARPPLSSFGGR